MKTLSFKIRQRLGSVDRSAVSWPVRDLPGSFHRVLRRNSNLFLVISDGDPGMDYVDIHFKNEMSDLEKTRGFSRIYVKGTDHLFTLKHARETVLKLISEYLAKNR